MHNDPCRLQALNKVIIHPAGVQRNTSVPLPSTADSCDAARVVMILGTTIISRISPRISDGVHLQRIVCFVPTSIDLHCSIIDGACLK